MKKVVLDSSVLVSAFLTPRGTPATLLARARRGAFSVHLSNEIIEETARALLRPKTMARYRYTAHDVKEYLVLLTEVTEAVEDIPTLRAVPIDPKEDMIVATAVKAGADYLVAGDRRHLVPLGEYRGSRIVTPREFLEILANE
jgi:putative PIN family toxin of toxin-antitoxin system